jgi:hypothetical protein
MVSHLVFSPLVLFALIWLFVILSLTWPKRSVAAPAAPAALQPLQSKRHGRVPVGCGQCFGTSPDPSVSCESVVTGCEFCKWP